MQSISKLRFITSISVFLLVGFHSIAQVSVETHPFLKWKATSKSMSYAKITIEPAGGNGTLLSNQITATQGVVIKLEKPTGFLEEDGKIFFGLGVTVTNLKTNEEEMNIADIYGSNEGVSADLLQNLSLRFSPDTSAKPLDSYLVKALFFDKKSDAQVLIEIPFVIQEHSDISFSIHNYSSWSMSPELSADWARFATRRK